MKLGRVLLIVLLAAGGFVGYRWFTLGKQAEGLAREVRQTVLDPADGSESPRSMVGRILEIGRNHGIQLDPERISVRTLNPERLSAADAVGIVNLDGTDLVLQVEMEYELGKPPIRRRIRQRLQRPLRGQGSAYLGGSPHPIGRAVDPPAPAKGVHQYRQDVQRAVQGRE